jgi:tRNA-dihydrouridine synthase A
MMGRAAYRDPWQLLNVDELFFGERAANISPVEALQGLLPYIERERMRDTPLHAITRHVLGLFHGVPGARAFRRYVATHALTAGAGPEVLLQALALLASASVSKAA